MEDEEKLLATFEKAPEFFETLSTLLDIDLQQDPTQNQEQMEKHLPYKLIRIIDEYQEQIYLLDSYLERMVTPIVEVFKTHAVNYVATRRSGKDAPYSSIRLTRLLHLLYGFIKSRGRKTIGKSVIVKPDLKNELVGGPTVNFFPHQVADLSIALDYLSDGPAQIPSEWLLRYIVLLWLSLICMIPFDLSRFDDDVIHLDNHGHQSTAQKLDALANGYLARPGLDREAAALLLSKLYSRKDTGALLTEFLINSTNSLEVSPEGYKAIGILLVLCELTKSGITEQVAPHVALIRHAMKIIEDEPRLMNNTLVRKYKVKLEGRLAIGLLPSARQTPQIVRDLHSGVSVEGGSENELQDVDISEGVERGISFLLDSLQDKDTVVRYSASKHLARVSSRLPSSLTEQVLQSVLQHFEIHFTPTGRVEDLPADAETTWHGACLACAEMSRRGLIPTKYLPQLLELLKKALLFDIRKGSHSVGSSVRDAASYVLWSLGRSQDARVFKPHALALAQRLVSVSLYDREVHIRRAASAAYQENVGRMDLFPHGIDVLRKMDFFAVGIRKNAFLVAARQVAVHLEYRLALIDHLINHTLIHWDSSIRILGAQSLRAICELDLERLGAETEEGLMSLLQSIDTNSVHGGLLGLSELAASYYSKGNLEENRLNIFMSLARLPPLMIQKYRHEQILEAACLFIANTISLSAINLDPSPAARWRTIVEQGLWHNEVAVQDAAARAMQSLSKLVDCSSDFVKEFAKGTPTVQQSVARSLGSLAYDQYAHAVHESLACLLGGVDSASSAFSSNVEARRNCYSAMAEILRILDRKIPQLLAPSIVNRVLHACILGLDDYTTDQRGDVGSWIRIACIRGLCSIVEVLFNLGPSLEHDPLQAWITPQTYQKILGNMLKQGVERLDNVRRQAGESFLKLLRRGPPNVDGAIEWDVRGSSLLRQLLLSDEEVGWNESQWLFPRAVQFLKVSEYRRIVLHGLVLSIGSKTDSTQRPVAMSFTEFVGTLPTFSGHAEDLDLLTITNDLLDLALKNLSSNQVIIPVLQTFDLLLDVGILEKLADNEAGVHVLNDVFDMSTRNVPRLKNTQRILASMKLVNGMLAVPCVIGKAVVLLPHFLLHPRPKIRTDTAENLYLVMQAKNFRIETDEVEEILLETDWSAPVYDLRAKVLNLTSFFK